MPIEFLQESQPTGSSDNSLFRLLMKYDGTGRRISKTVMHKVAGAADWDTVKVTHYTGIGTEVRENFVGPAKETKVVVNMPQGLGRYGIEDAENPDMGSGVGYIPNTKFEWYLKNHLGSTMLVYGTQADANPAHSDIGTPLAAYDYRAFGEMVELLPPSTGKVTENFTGKERDDEIALDYFGARYLDPMLGMWISVDPKRQHPNPYLYAGNNPIMRIDPDGNMDGKGVFKTIVHTTIAAATAYGTIQAGPVMCTATVVGCGIAVTTLGVSALDLMFAVPNFFADADKQVWPSMEILNKMPDGVQDAVSTYGKISSVKDFITQDFLPLALQFIETQIDDFKPSSPMNEINIEEPPSASSSMVPIDFDE